MNRIVTILLAAGLLLGFGTAADAVTILGTGTGALVGGDITDPQDDIVDNTGDLLGGTASSGKNFNWISSATNESNYFGDPSSTNRQGALDLFDNKADGSTNSKWCCGGASTANPKWVALEFANAYFLESFTITSGGDAAWRRPTEWEIQGSNDGTNFTTIHSQSGSVWSAHKQVVLFESDTANPGSPDYATPDAYRYFRYSATNTLGGSGRSPGQEHQLEEIEYFGSVVPEPTTLLIWSLLTGLGVALGGRRRK